MKSHKIKMRTKRAQIKYWHDEAIMNCRKISDENEYQFWLGRQKALEDVINLYDKTILFNKGRIIK